MDQNKIGKFISSERKKKKLTQKKLAEKLNISEKTISKWECGKGLPEVSLMQPLCQELNITVTELLNGQKNITEESGIINYMTYTKKKSKHKLALISIIFILLITFILSTVCFFFNNYNKIKIYKFYGESENFSYSGMYLTESNTIYMLTTGELEPKDPNKIKKDDIIQAIIKSNDRTIFSGKANITHIENNGYNEFFDEDKINNIDNWYIEVTYKENNEKKTEMIPLEKEIIMRNTDFFTKTIEPIGESDKTNEEEIKAIRESKIKEIDRRGKILISEKYNEYYKDEIYGDIALYRKETTKETTDILLDLISPELTYFYKINENVTIWYCRRLGYEKYERLKEELEINIIINDEEYKYIYYPEDNRIELNEDFDTSVDLLKYSKQIELKIKEIYDLLYE